MFHRGADDAVDTEVECVGAAVGQDDAFGLRCIDELGDSLAGDFDRFRSSPCEQVPAASGVARFGLEKIGHRFGDSVGFGPTGRSVVKVQKTCV